MALALLLEGELHANEKNGLAKMTKRTAQEWGSRREIPDPQVKDAADQYERAREVLHAQGAHSGVVWPLMHSASIAIELYLKCLSAEKVHVHTDDAPDVFTVHSRPVWGHALANLFDEIPEEIRGILSAEFSEDRRALRDCLIRLEGVFMRTRYPFEEASDPATLDMSLLARVSEFLSRFVDDLDPRETVDWN